MKHRSQCSSNRKLQAPELLRSRKVAMKLLTESEDLFDGTLGDWDTEPCLPEIMGGHKAISWQAFSNSKNPQGISERGA
jgi:hypothetical protein